MTRLRRASAWLLPLVVGFLLRLPGLEARPIWYDEAFSRLLAARSFHEILGGTAADTMPPLYYLLLAAWTRLGTGIWQQRALNVVLGTALVGVVFLLGRELYDRKVGGWASLLASISPLLVFHSQELRMYSLLTLGLAAYIYFFLLTRREGRGSRGGLAWAGLIASGTVALYTHNLAIFSIIALDAYLVVRRERRALGRLLLSQLAMVALFVPWLVLVPGQIQKIQAAFWTPRPGILEVVQGVVAFHTWLPLPPALTAMAVACSLTAIGLTTYIVVRRLPHTWRDGLLASLVLVPPGLLFAASYIMRPLYVPRAYMLSLVAYLVLAGRAIAEVRPRLIGGVLAGAFVVSAAVGLPAQASYASFPRSPFPQAAAYLQSTLAAGDIILHDNKLSYFPMYVYGPELPQVFLPDEPGSHNDTLAQRTQQALGLAPAPDIETAVRSAPRVRYVVFQRELDELAVTAIGLPPALAWLYDHGVMTSRRAFNDLWIYDFSLSS